MLASAGHRATMPGLALIALVPAAVGAEGSLPAAAGADASLPAAAAPQEAAGASAPAAVDEPVGRAPARRATRREPTGPGLDLRGFLVRVLDRSLEAEAAALRREAAGHDADALRSPLNPSLEAEGPDGDGEAQVQLLQPFRLFGRGDALRRVGRARRSLADRRLTTEHASLAREAARAWVEAVAGRRRLSLAERAADLRGDALERAEAALRRGWGGRERVADVRLEARAATREAEALRSAAGRDRRRLKRLLGRPADGPLPVDGGLAGDPDPGRLPPVPDELPPDAPTVELARADARLAEAELARTRTAARPVPAVGPMVSFGDGVVPGVGLQLSLPLWSRNREATDAARSRLEASRLAEEATRRSAAAAYRRLLDRRDALSGQLERIRARELEPARREAERWTASRELGLPVADRRRRARARLLALRREELDLQLRLSLLQVDAAWRSGALLAWLRDEPAGPPSRDDRR